MFSGVLGDLLSGEAQLPDYMYGGCADCPLSIPPALRPAMPTAHAHAHASPLPSPFLKHAHTRPTLKHSFPPFRLRSLSSSLPTNTYGALHVPTLTTSTERIDDIHIASVMHMIISHSSVPTESREPEPAFHAAVELKLAERRHLIVDLRIPIHVPYAYMMRCHERRMIRSASCWSYIHVPVRCVTRTFDIIDVVPRGESNVRGNCHYLTKVLSGAHTHISPFILHRHRRLCIS